MADIRGPHDATFMINVGTRKEPKWDRLILRGVKFDDVTGQAVVSTGMNRDDTIRLLIYFTRVIINKWDREIPTGSYFARGIHDTPDNPGEWKRNTRGVWQVKTSKLRDSAGPSIHHLEILGR